MRPPPMLDRLRDRLLVAAAALCLVAPPLAAQTWRNLEVSRQLRDSSPVHVRVTYGAGRVGVRAATSPVLYQMRLRYDAERAEPVHAFQPDQQSLRLGLRKQSVGVSIGKDDDDRRGSELEVDLTPRVPLDLALELGAVEADLDLTGLALTSLKLETGASETRIRFDTLNAVRMRSLELSLGAASVRVARLGNANADEVRVSGGVGEVELDFGGQWTHDVELDVKVGLGGIKLRVPREVGIRVEMERFLASFDHGGLQKRGGFYYSDNWDTATYRLRIKTQAALGSIDLDRTD